MLHLLCSFRALCKHQLHHLCKSASLQAYTVCMQACVWFQVCDRSRVWQLVVCHHWLCFCSVHMNENVIAVSANVASPSSRVFICSVSADLIRLYHGKKSTLLPSRVLATEPTLTQRRLSDVFMPTSAEKPGEV